MAKLKTKAKRTPKHGHRANPSKKQSEKKKEKVKPSPQTTADRPIVYDRVSVKLLAGDEEMTAALARTLLGWQAEPDGGNKWGSDYLVRDVYGRKIRCLNNTRNRYPNGAWINTLKAEHLHRRWQLNGEPIIIGNRGQVIDGQHTLISLVLAAQEYKRDPDRWAQWWDREPTMPKIIVRGIDESNKVVNTLNTGRPRTLADVIFRSEYFAEVKAGERRAISRMTEYAVKLLWERTGAKANAYAPMRTHSESLDFLSRHERLLTCVRHVYEENGDGGISRIISPGYTSGLLYLMGCSTSDPDRYLKADPPHERELDWQLWDKACEYWVLVAQDVPELRPIRLALGALSADEQHGDPTHDEKVAVAIKGWLLFAADEKLTPAKLALQHRVDPDGVRHLAEHPNTGGIDVGSRPQE